MSSPFFSTAEQLYTCAQALFERVQQADPAATAQITNGRLVICLRCTEPTAEITVNGRQRPLQLIYGPSNIRPELDVELTGDNLHQILLGQLTLKKAVATRLLKVKGPVWKVAALYDLFARGQTLYPQILRDHGLTP
jgi:hypothetical protein